MICVLLRLIRGDPHMVTDSRCPLSYYLPPSSASLPEVVDCAFYDLGFCRGIPDCQFARPEMNRGAGRV